MLVRSDDRLRHNAARVAVLRRAARVGRRSVAAVDRIARYAANRCLCSDAAYLCSSVGRLVRSYRQKAANSDRYWGVYSCAGNVRSVHFTLAAICGADSWWHFIIGDTACLGGLCCGHDDEPRAESWDGVDRHNGESRRCCWARARWASLAARLAF